MNSYELSRNWFDFCFENPEKIKPNHTALFFFAIEHCNRLGWKEKFGLPTEMTKEAIGIKSYNTYINTLNDLIEWGFIILIEKSQNQYSSNIVAISKFNKPHTKPLDKAMINHTSKQSETTSESIGSINKQLNNITKNIDDVLLSAGQCKEKYLSDKKIVKAVCENTKNNISELEIEERLNKFNSMITENGDYSKTFKDYCKHFLSWHKLNRSKQNTKIKTKGFL